MQWRGPGSSRIWGVPITGYMYIYAVYMQYACTVCIYVDWRVLWSFFRVVLPFQYQYSPIWRKNRPSEVRASWAMFQNFYTEKGRSFTVTDIVISLIIIRSCCLWNLHCVNSWSDLEVVSHSNYVPDISCMWRSNVASESILNQSIPIASIAMICLLCLNQFSSGFCQPLEY